MGRPSWRGGVRRAAAVFLALTDVCAAASAVSPSLAAALAPEQLASAVCINPLQDTNVVEGVYTTKLPSGARVDHDGECCALCQADAECVAWVLHPDGHCATLSSYSGTAPQVSYKHGQKQLVSAGEPSCEEPLQDTALAGGVPSPTDPKGVGVFVGKDMAACCALCEADDGCGAWVHSVAGRCFLYSAFDGKVAMANSTMGCHSNGCDARSPALMLDSQIFQRPRQQHIENGGTNIVYIKIPKTASSTTSGVARRVADHHQIHGVRDDLTWIKNLSKGEPGVWASFGTMQNQKLAPSDLLISQLKKPTFLFTMVRDPFERAMSEFYHFGVARAGLPDTAAEKIKYLSQFKNFQYSYIATSQHETISSIMNRYNLIGVDELYNSSMIALAKRMHVQVTNVLYLSSKVSNLTHVDSTGARFVPHISLADEPQKVRDYVEVFKKRNAKDYALWTAAKKVIKDEIKGLEGTLTDYEYKLNILWMLCGKNTKKPQKDAYSCYAGDNGCAHDCIDMHEEDYLYVACPWCGHSDNRHEVDPSPSPTSNLNGMLKVVPGMAMRAQKQYAQYADAAEASR